ncbi:hypothetical protein G9C85_06600 [Halorubellus sp. JP-L1]|uniref:HalOD1 output domain-containing protein n=1 Tax=Halorubellus sp. JP-L1 TaxID=2715753 RepID=UPI00140975C3|nr:HalOD1 output domain-containing protein [Halorubellus sp. JP-L1]NHN41305.1 hypothetical protein [Halorubellus sp. JP-L1]
MDERPYEGSEDHQGSDIEHIQNEYDWSSTNPSVAIVETVAVTLNREPNKLPPLYDFIDPDAIDALLSRPNSRGVHLSFVYAGVRITVDDDGTVTIHPRGED